MARCTTRAATAESTPPESAQSTRSPPTAARTAATASSTTEAAFPARRATAEAVHGHAQPELPPVHARRPLLVPAVGAAREHDPARRARAQGGHGGAGRKDLRVDLQLAQAACDELGVLRAEIEDDDRVAVHAGSRSRRLYSALPSAML